MIKCHHSKTNIINLTHQDSLSSATLFINICPISLFLITLLWKKFPKYSQKPAGESKANKSEPAPIKSLTLPRQIRDRVIYTPVHWDIMQHMEKIIRKIIMMKPPFGFSLFIFFSVIYF
jgi:hypothetical protein